MYYQNGKQVLFKNAGEETVTHICDARDYEAAHSIVSRMNAGAYVEEARVTLSPSWHGDKVARHVFVQALNAAIDAANQLDKVKKTLFYGRDNNIDPREGQQSIEDLPSIIAVPDSSPANIIHAIIGIFTEAGEMLEALKDAINKGEPIDFVNAMEETGDLFWYAAILAHECGFTFDEAQSVNIAKLRARFPDKFTEFDANNRDLSIERQILETGTPRDVAEHALPINERTRRMEGERNLDGDAIEAQTPRK